MSQIPSPAELGLPKKYSEWREHQPPAIRLIDEAKHSTVGMMLPPGAGKSGIYMGWAAWRKKRMCVVVPNKMLQDQVYEDFKGLGMLDLRGQSDPRYTCEVTDGLVSDAPCHGGYDCSIKSSCEYFAKLKRAPSEQLIVTNYAFWMHNKGVLGDFDAVVFDECFIGSTKVSMAAGEKRIDAVCKGDLIKSSLGESQVLSTFSRRVYSTVHVRLSNGRSFECTPDHPIFTEVGWRPAGSLDRGQGLLREEEVRRLWPGVPPVLPTSGRPRWGTRIGDEVFEARRLRKILLEEAEEPDAQQKLPVENASDFDSIGPSSFRAGGKRRSAFQNPSTIGEVTRGGVGTGRGCENSQSPVHKVSRALQGGPSESVSSSSSGVGWVESRSPQKATRRSQKRQIPARVWVQRVTPKEYPSGILVYNLRVSRHPSYFANGVLVHNCHQAFHQLAQWANITFSKALVKEYFHRPPIRDWKPWASYQRSLTTDMLRALKDKKGKTADDWDEIRVVKRLHDKLQTLCDADPKTLIYQESHTGWTWDCVWPGAYRKFLTTNAKKYIFTSGTMTRRTFRMLGYAQDEYTWGEFPSTFSIKRCPIFILPAPGLNFHSSASELRLHQEVMDRFLDQFPNCRGLVHSGSYARAGQILLSSRHSARMITHNNSKGLGEAKERYYEQENAILISPAIVEGEDFAYDKARFQVVAKMPFTNPSDPIEAERTRQDEQYPWYTAAQKIMQARGRVMRGEDDFGITAICDGAWDNWFFKRSKHHFTSYFIDAITPLDALSKVKIPISTKPAPIQAKIDAPVFEKKLDTPPHTSALSTPRVALFRANSPKKPTRRKPNVE